MEKLTLREYAEENGYEIFTNDDVEDRFRDDIDTFNNVEIMGMSYCASQVLEKLDPTAYRCSFNDWLDSEEYDKFEGDYMKRDDIEKVTEEYETYLEELENEEE